MCACHSRIIAGSLTRKVACAGLPAPGHHGWWARCGGCVPATQSSFRHDREYCRSSLLLRFQPCLFDDVLGCYPILFEIALEFLWRVTDGFQTAIQHLLLAETWIVDDINTGLVQ